MTTQPISTPDCPECGIGAFVNATELGYLCTLCLHHWPYEAPKPIDRHSCGCEPDFDYEREHYVHAPECKGYEE